MNIGGKPYNSWPQWIPITFELTILGAALSAVFGMLAHERPADAVSSDVQRARVSRWLRRDRFFLCIKARDKKFDLAQTKAFLESLEPHGVFEIED